MDDEDDGLGPAPDPADYDPEHYWMTRAEAAEAALAAERARYARRPLGPQPDNLEGPPAPWDGVPLLGWWHHRKLPSVVWYRSFAGWCATDMSRLPGAPDFVQPIRWPEDGAK